MPNTITLQTQRGKTVSYIDECIGSGAMKDVYFSPDKSYVVAFFRDEQNREARERIETIVGPYRERIFQQEGGAYWADVFCWPYDIVEHNGLLGIVAPTYQSHFFFEFGSKNNDFLGIRGKEKEGKWFASANHQNKHLAPEERGNWRSYFSLCIKISRAVQRMHMAGLAHSDLSYKNVLVDPRSGNACIIDIDGLVVPNKYAPDVVGTPDFIAPEVMATLNLSRDDPNRKLPRIETDRHAIAVLIYMYLLYRHPLRGGKIHDADPEIDEKLGMGKNALFVEHPTNDANRPRLSDVKPGALPWADVEKRPYSLLGPYLKPLVERAFIDGLHDPTKRPSANEWEVALVRSVDLMQPCASPRCDQKWYIFDNTQSPRCPFCNTRYQGDLPVLNLYAARGEDDDGNKRFLPENHRIMVYHNQYLYPWHANRRVVPGAKLTAAQKIPVGYFVMHQGRWVLVNQTLDSLRDVTDPDRETHREIPKGEMVVLEDNQKLLLSDEDGGRLVHIQMVSG